MDTTNEQKLDALQAEVGYNYSGQYINTIALLGLFGEVGELLAEVETDDLQLREAIKSAVAAATHIERLKKMFRDNPEIPTPKVFIEYENIPKFDNELADVNYYIRAIMRNRNINSDLLAKWSCDKIEKKRLQKNISHGAPTGNINTTATPTGNISTAAGFSGETRVDPGKGCNTPRLDPNAPGNNLEADPSQNSNY